jgi:hypothetical protein
MYGLKSDNPVEVFEGHDDVVKEFVWRNKGGHDQEFEDREFQLITWSKDRTLRIWPVSEEVTERVGYKFESFFPGRERRISHIPELQMWMRNNSYLLH